MTVSGRDLVPKETIEELLLHRQRALEKFAEAAEAMAAAGDAARRAMPGQHFSLTEQQLSYCPQGNHATSTRRSREEWMAVVRRELDLRLWEHLITRSRLTEVMDHKARTEFRDSLRGHQAVIPECTLESVQATLFAHISQAEEVLKRGVKTLFHQLHPRFKTHDPFKYGHRFIVNGMFSVSKWRDGAHLSRGYGWRDEQLVDLERILYVLDGKPPPEHVATFWARLNAAHPTLTKAPMEFEDDYLHMRWFLNGNAHVRIKRDDLVDRINAILAEDGGIPDGTQHGRAA
ncbi:MAG: hypothetical protein RJA36_1400 [Pseudomonadota bacterium]|jgi:hypothetical protein